MNDEIKLMKFLKGMEFAMMTTSNKDGGLYSRPMATLEVEEEDFDGKLWFFTKLNTPKVNELYGNPHVNLSYMNSSKQKYASVSGRASISQDRQKMSELWNPLFSTWFPEGLEDPEIALISVTVDSAELWDSPPSSVVQLAGFLKAKITGEAWDHSNDQETLHLRGNH
jgi:general stress protein 26